MNKYYKIQSNCFSAQCLVSNQISNFYGWQVANSGYHRAHPTAPAQTGQHQLCTLMKFAIVCLFLNFVVFYSLYFVSLPFVQDFFISFPLWHNGSQWWCCLLPVGGAGTGQRAQSLALSTHKARHCLDILGTRFWATDTIKDPLIKGINPPFYKYLYSKFVNCTRILFVFFCGIKNSHSNIP